MNEEMERAAYILADEAMKGLVIRASYSEMKGYPPFSEKNGKTVTIIRIFSVFQGSVTKDSNPNNVFCDLSYSLTEPFPKETELSSCCTVTFAHNQQLECLESSIEQWVGNPDCRYYWYWASSKTEVCVHQDQDENLSEVPISDFHIIQHIARIQTWLGIEINRPNRIPHTYSWTMCPLLDRISALQRKQNHAWYSTVGI